LKSTIAAAATTVLLRDGLQKWSVDRVAAEAGCAKGLVPYHHGSKKNLLATVAAGLHRARVDRRLAALEGAGADALDRLWDVLAREVTSGEWAAWTALVAAPEIPCPRPSAADLTAFATAAGRALGIPPLRSDEVLLASAGLDGFQSALHLGAPSEAIHEAFHRLWLVLLP